MQQLGLQQIMKRRSRRGYCAELLEWMPFELSGGSLIIERHKCRKYGQHFGYTAYPYLWDDIGRNNYLKHRRMT